MQAYSALRVDDYSGQWITESGPRATRCPCWMRESCARDWHSAGAPSCWNARCAPFPRFPSQPDDGVSMGARSRMLPRNRYNRSHVCDSRLGVKPKVCHRSQQIGRRGRTQPRGGFGAPRRSRPTPSALCGLQRTIIHRAQGSNARAAAWSSLQSLAGLFFHYPCNRGAAHPSRTRNRTLW